MVERSEELAMRVWFRLIRLEARMQVAITERLREISLSVPQCDVLTTLTEQEGVSQQLLAKRLYVTKGNISGLLDRLETAGLVERRSTESDRRQYEIYLTPAGRVAAQKGDRLAARVHQLDVRPARRSGPDRTRTAAGETARPIPRGSGAARGRERVSSL